VAEAELLAQLERLNQVPAPCHKLPFALLSTTVFFEEMKARLTGKPALLSLDTVNLMKREAGRFHSNHAKSERELGQTFRPVKDTLRDEAAWFRGNGYSKP